MSMTQTAQLAVDNARRGYEAFAKGDLEAIKSLVAPGARIHVSGRSAVSGEYSGPDGFLSWLGKVFELSGGTAKADVHDIIASDDHLIVLSTGSAERNGKKLELQQVQVSHVDSEGRLAESWFLTTDEHAAEEFWA